MEYKWHCTEFIILHHLTDGRIYYWFVLLGSNQHLEAWKNILVLWSLRSTQWFFITHTPEQFTNLVTWTLQLVQITMGREMWDHEYWASLSFLYNYTNIWLHSMSTMDTLQKCYQHLIKLHVNHGHITKMLRACPR